MYRDLDESRPDGGSRDATNIRDAVRFCVAVVVAAAAFLVVAALWLGTCHGATADPLACGAPQRTVLALGAPVILLAGGVRAHLRAWFAVAGLLVTLGLAVGTMCLLPVLG